MKCEARFPRLRSAAFEDVCVLSPGGVERRERELPVVQYLRVSQGDCLPGDAAHRNSQPPGEVLPEIDDDFAAGRVQRRDGLDLLDAPDGRVSWNNESLEAMCHELHSLPVPIVVASL